MTSERRRWAAWVAALTVVVGAACGDAGSGPRASDTTAPPDPSSTTSSTEAVERSAPRWETVTTLTGSGATTTDPFEILPDAIQWRIRWTCQAGSLRVVTVPPPRRGEPAVDGACPGDDEGFSIVTGSVRLAVQATGPWTLVVDQQVDVPLREPPLEGMDTAPALAQGAFYNVEMEGKGTARLHRLADGRLALRFEPDFQVSNNTDLFLWLSTAPEPRTSADAVGSPHVVIGNLRSTLGSQNYVLPPDMTPDKVRSVVIWCQPVSVAYTAAALEPPA